MTQTHLDALAHARLQDLKDTAQKLSVEIEFTRFEESDFAIQSGLCKVRGQSLILVDRALPVTRQIEIILNALRQFDLDHLYIASWIRERLDNPETTPLAS
ncbi:MAG: hypothetical protein GWM98_00285 [Nitrospinaceae bacterium]|nr:hypothetical protein [Nitrospinaceae bacterium]NIR53241.1 hypothetical protein [Nitrospinaceae bacterium]NIS83639.1 hypothetical protein [Nitrospinaceae bacterium]NIT80430.1 hypothetical protein [Nitrospinaceae bacterium]NIU42768.1 hypothetical protein [Nitrospinaceae bacterium]